MNIIFQLEFEIANLLAMCVWALALFIYLFIYRSQFIYLFIYFDVFTHVLALGLTIFLTWFKFLSNPRWRIF